MHYDYQLKCFLPDIDDFNRHTNTNTNTNITVRSFLIVIIGSILISILCVVCYNIVDYYKQPTVDITGNNDKEVVYYNGRPISVHRDINDY